MIIPRNPAVWWGFSYAQTTESITTPHIHTRAVSRRSI